MFWVLGALLIGLTAIHMARPRVERRAISSAAFFENLPLPRLSRSRLRFGPPRLSRSFFLQILVLALLAAAILNATRTYLTGSVQVNGVYVLLDTSASMSTMEDTGTRMDKARTEIERVLADLAARDRDAALCLSLSAFDMERRDFLSESTAPDILAILQSLKPRALATDLGLIRNIAQTFAEKNSDCPPTHLLVVTDMPAPEWVSEPLPIAIVWRDIGTPTGNLGISGIQSLQDPLTGEIRRLVLAVTAYGRPPAGARVTVTGEDGKVHLVEPIVIRDDGTWRRGLTLTPGRYTIRIEPGGAYAHDDTAIIDLVDAEPIRVDWRLPDRSIPRLLGWIETLETPDFRVLSGTDSSDPTPTILVGNVPSHPGNPIQILDFLEGDLLLEDLNLDALEASGFKGAELDPSFVPVLRAGTGESLVGSRIQPPSVYIPAPPAMNETVNDRVSTTLFFNAVRFLLRGRNVTPPFTLTDPGNPEPAGNRIALHEGEGNTTRIPYSYGDFDRIGNGTVPGERRPMWPILLAAAALIWIFERIMAAIGGARWR